MAKTKKEVPAVKGELFQRFQALADEALTTLPEGQYRDFLDEVGSDVELREMALDEEEGEG